MRINSGLLDGSVTTAKLADGAVTTAKVNTSDFSPLITAQLNVAGEIASYTDSYPGLELFNAASAQHWFIGENSSDGTQQACKIRDSVAGLDCLLVAPGGVVTLSSPLPEASGGTGAASMLSAGLMKEVADTGWVTGNTTTQNPTIMANAPVGTYLVIGAISLHYSSSATYDLEIVINVTNTTIGGVNLLRYGASDNTSGIYGASGLVDVGTAGAMTANLGAVMSGSDTFDYRVRVYQMA